MALSAAERRSPDIVRPNMGIDVDCLNIDNLEIENMVMEETINQAEAFKKYEERFHVFNNKSKGPNDGQDDEVNSLLTKVFQKTKGNESERQSNPVSSLSSIRIVLLGKTGAGKSAAGNTILGQRVFGSELNVDSVTRKYLDAHGTVSERYVSVIDTPGFFDTEMKPEQLVAEMARCVYLSSPGPHAFLIVLRADERLTKHEQPNPKMIETMFGEEVLKYSIILFTHGDQLKGESVKELIEGNSKLKHLVDQCGGRFQVFNNKNKRNREQVNDLLQKIDTMIEQNDGYYNNQMFGDAKRFRREKKEMKQQEEEQWKQQEEKQRNKEIGRMIKKIGAELEAQKWLETDRRKTKIQSDFEEAMHCIGFCPSIRST